MKSIKVSAPGKLILLGEHVVVYGKPAIITSVAKRCHVTITPRKDTAIEIISKNLNVSEKLDEKTLLAKTKAAHKKWNEFSKTNDAVVLKSITANSLDYATIAIGESLLCYKKTLQSGFTLTIDSEVPIGSGMGSSASLAVAITAAITLLLGKPFDKETINTLAFLAEQKRHGFPSGGDNSACCYGGLVWHRRETPDFKIIQPVPFTLSPHVAKNFLTIFTGVPHESTGEMVSAVRALYNSRKSFVDSVFTDQESLVRNLLSAMKQENHEEIIRIIRKGEKNLEKIGVVSPYVTSIIRKIEKSGGAAKICGGGGKTKGTGTILAYHQNGKLLEKVLRPYKLSHSQIMLGVEGVREKRY